MSRWNGNGSNGMYDEDEGGFGYDQQTESEQPSVPSRPTPQSSAPTPKVPTVRRQRMSESLREDRRSQGTLGAQEMGWIASLVDEYIATPEFISAQLDKLSKDPKLDELISKKITPYYPFLVLAGIAVGAFGAFLIDAWRGATSESRGGFLKNISRKLLA